MHYLLYLVYCVKERSEDVCIVVRHLALNNRHKTLKAHSCVNMLVG